MSAWIKNEMNAAAQLLRRLADDDAFSERIETICQTVVQRLREGGKILTCGNGGSATDAQHLAEELVGRYRSNRRPLPAVALTADGSALTCIANDFAFDEVFARQVEALCDARDVLVVFSTSGASPNIVKALEVARAKGAVAIGLLGRDGGPAAALCDHAFIVPHEASARIQEAHALALHLLCEAVEREFA